MKMSEKTMECVSPTSENELKPKNNKKIFISYSQYIKNNPDAYDIKADPTVYYQVSHTMLSFSFF